MTEKKVEKYSLSILKDMKVGEKIIFPIENMATIRTQTSLYGGVWDRVFKTKMVRSSRTFEVIRIR